MAGLERVAENDAYCPMFLSRKTSFCLRAAARVAFFSGGSSFEFVSEVCGFITFRVLELGGYPSTHLRPPTATVWVEYVVLQFEDGKSHDIFGARTCRQLLRTRLTDAERCVLLLRTRPLAFELPSIHPTTGCRHFGARYGRQTRSRGSYESARVVRKKTGLYGVVGRNLRIRSTRPFWNEKRGWS